MVEFLFTEDNHSVDSEEQPSKYFYDVSTSIMLNNVTLHNIIFVDQKHHLEFRHFNNFYLAISLSVLVSSLVFEIYNGPEYVSAEAAT